MKTLLKQKVVLFSLLVLAIMSSCTSYKKVPYIQNSSEFKDTTEGIGAANPRIMPHDILNIVVVNSQDQHTAMSYNLLAPLDMSRTTSIYSNDRIQLIFI